MQVRVRIKRFVGETDDPAAAAMHLGQWLVAYDPKSELVVSTANIREAKVFGSFQLAHAYLLRYARKREDGQPDRPITAFELDIVGGECPN